MAGARSRARRNWPTNLHLKVAKGKKYYSYRNPETGRSTGLGSDFEVAKKAVLAITAKRAPEPVAAAVARIEKPKRTLGEHLIWYDEEVLHKQVSPKGRPLSKTTLYEHGRMLTVIADKMGPSRDLRTIDRQAIAEFLNGFPSRASNVYRSLLGKVFRHAVAQGYRDDNPVSLTIEKVEVVQRQRLPLEHLEKITEAADPWFKRVLNLARWSLQRREDLTLWQVSAWSEERLSIKQKKVEGHGMGMLRIAPGEHLHAAVLACIDSPERGDCPFLLHRIPERMIEADWKVHHKQLAPRMLSDEFARLRDSAVPEYKSIPKAKRPTFHEIRATGADYYRDKLKWSETKIQLLLGHSSEQMTRVYLDRHGERWIEVESA